MISKKKVVKIDYEKLYKSEKEKSKKLEYELEQCKKEIDTNNKILKNKDKEIEELKKTLENKNAISLKKPKGSKCSVSGNNYEKKIIM